MAITHDINDLEHFNRWSRTYERSLAQWFMFDRVHRGVLKRLPEGFRPAGILDIGCGTGRLLRRMHARWPEADLMGVDLAEGMVAQARERTPEARITRAPAEHLPLPDGSVDLVTSTVSFHHWTSQVEGVREAARVLREGGLFVLADGNIGHGHPLTKRQLREAFQGAGLSIRLQNSPVPFFTFTIGEK